MKKSILALSVLALCACGGTPGGSGATSSSIAEKAASIYFPTATGRDSGEGIDVFMDMGPVRLTYIYTGEGVHEEILRYEYNEDLRAARLDKRRHSLLRGFLLRHQVQLDHLL